MLPSSQPRKKRNSSKVNLLISFIFHAVLVLVLAYFAARQGLLGKQLKKISIEMVKEKPPEKPKEPPKVEPPKVEPPKVVEAPKAPPMHFLLTISGKVIDQASVRDAASFQAR